ncbi:MAG: hypothetical protein WBM76_01150 [Woeseiaceae bacterium]|jgi:hypothetical protein
MVISRTCIIAAVLCLCWTATVADEADGNEPNPAWAWSNIYKTKFGRSKTPLGIGIYTTRKKSFGVGFRCEQYKLYAFVAVKRVSVRDTMIRGARKPQWWDVNYSIDGAEETGEEWISIHNGLMFMVKSRETSFAIFEAAKLGKTMTVRPKNGKAVSIALPADTTGIFDRFWNECGLGVTAAVDLPRADLQY